MLVVASCSGAGFLPVELLHCRWDNEEVQHNLKPSARQLTLGHNWMFQQNIDLKHTLKLEWITLIKNICGLGCKVRFVLENTQISINSTISANSGKLSKQNLARSLFSTESIWSR